METNHLVGRSGPNDLDAKQKEVFDWGYLAKGIAIILVVAGHFRPTWAPPLWLAIVDLIYEFHIPAFFIVAGLFYNPNRPWLEVIRKKVFRLALPFFTVAVLFLAIKSLSGLFVTLEKPVDLQTVTALALQPKVSFAPFLWFLIALMFVFATYPMAKIVFRRTWIVLIFAIALRLAPLPDQPTLNLLVDHLPFFSLGVALRSFIPYMQKRSEWFLILSMTFFVLSNIAWSIPSSLQFHRGLVLLQGTAGGLWVVFLSMFWERHPLFPRGYHWVWVCGQASMVVYILHTPFQSAVRILYFMTGVQSLLWGVVFLSGVVGVVCPLWVDRFILSRIPPVRRLLLGEG